MIGILGLLIAIAVLAYFAYKGVGALPLTLLAGLIVILTNGMNLWTAYSDYYLAGYVGFFKNYFLIFAASALYAKIMEDSGAAIAIGYQFIDWFGKKNAVLVVFLATAALTYGGISLFVVVFAVLPIIMVLFKEGDIPRKLAAGCMGAGAATITMTTLPASPQLTNVIPAKFLGTPLTAAPVLSIIIAIAQFVLLYGYLKWEEKRLRAAGEHFTYIEGQDSSKYEVDRRQLPSASLSFVPLIVLVGMIITMKKIIPNATALVVLSMSVATGLAVILNWSRLKDKMTTINQGLASAVPAIASPCAVVAFGTLVQNSASFGRVVEWINGFQMNPYITGTAATAIISGITGSSSGGLQITLQTFSEQFIQSGANLEILHRLIAIAAGSLDSLPHSAGIFLMLAILGLNHKNSYKYFFVTTVLIPLVTFVIFTTGVIVLGL
ncbi:GntP family permease [Geosporobacter ferrireducens]|uniref:GntP family permease n=1 Tax=Geosporobacter ferrireducens TaxID=1424294 RepID=UPI00139EC25D|nr:GntP family permease [Geosporobacter ferrireducens]MTI56579.1 GntP family permease [Geosporobacter ferrireducens]